MERIMKQYEKELQESAVMGDEKEIQLRKMVHRLSDLVHSNVDLVHNMAKEIGEQHKLLKDQYKDQYTNMMNMIRELAIRNNEDIRMVNERIDNKMNFMNPFSGYERSEEEISKLVQALMAPDVRKRRDTAELDIHLSNMSYVDLTPMAKFNASNQIIPNDSQKGLVGLSIFVPICVMFLFTWFCIWRLYIKIRNLTGILCIHIIYDAIIYKYF